MADTALAQVDLRAYEPRAEVDITGGATVAQPDGRTFDIKKALESDESGPAGTIVVDAQENPGLAEVLTSSPILKPAKVPDDLQAEAEKQNKRAAKAAASADDGPLPVGVDSIRAQEEHARSLQGQTSDAAPRGARK